MQQEIRDIITFLDFFEKHKIYNIFFKLSKQLILNINLIVH